MLLEYLFIFLWSLHLTGACQYISVELGLILISTDETSRMMNRFFTVLSTFKGPCFIHFFFSYSYLMTNLDVAVVDVVVDIVVCLAIAILQRLMLQHLQMSYTRFPINLHYGYNADTLYTAAGKWKAYVQIDGNGFFPDFLQE